MFRHVEQSSAGQFRSKDDQSDYQRWLKHVEASVTGVDRPVVSSLLLASDVPRSVPSAVSPHQLEGCH